LPANASGEVLLDALAARTGDERAYFERVLFGPEPQDDDELELRTRELLLLVEQVTRGRSQ
jgi:hypothetical protein